MSRAETIMAALAAADLAEAKGDLHRAHELLVQVEREKLLGCRTLIGIAPPAPKSAPMPFVPSRRITPAGQYSIVRRRNP